MSRRGELGKPDGERTCVVGGECHEGKRFPGRAPEGGRIRGQRSTWVRWTGGGYVLGDACRGICLGGWSVTLGCELGEWGVHGMVLVTTKTRGTI